MTYRIVLSKAALRTLQRLPPKVTEVLHKFVYGPLAENPHRVGKALREEWKGTYSARRGDYRVLYNIIEAEVVVHVVKVGPRSSVYRHS